MTVRASGIQAQRRVPEDPAGVVRGTLSAPLNLEALEVGSRYSLVRRARFPIDPMARFARDGVEVEPSADLRDTVALLEWAHGYRSESRRRGAEPLRRSASAGALYPIECLIVHTGPTGTDAVYYYDFRRHRLLRLAGAAPMGVRERLEAGDGPLIVLSAVLWRSAHRYGARSYLYCLLDAGEVAFNLAEAGRAFGRRVRVTCSAPSDVDAEALQLNATESALLALEVEAPAGGVQPGSLPLPPTVSASIIAEPDDTLGPPPLSPVLRRIRSYRAGARAGAGARTVPPSLSGPRGDRDYASLIERRESAAQFGGRQLARADHDALVACAGHTRDHLRRTGAPALRLTVVSIDVEGCFAGAREIGDAGALGVWQSRAVHSDELRTRLRSVCEEQAVAGQSSMAIVVSVDRRCLVQRGIGFFEDAAIGAGAISASLYLEAARTGVGTTALGGFNTEALAQLMGVPDRWSFVIQAFGSRDHSHAPKLDATAAGTG